MFAIFKYKTTVRTCCRYYCAVRQPVRETGLRAARGLRPNRRRRPKWSSPDARVELTVRELPVGFLPCWQQPRSRVSNIVVNRLILTPHFSARYRILTVASIVELCTAVVFVVDVVPTIVESLPFARPLFIVAWVLPIFVHVLSRREGLRHQSTARFRRTTIRGATSEARVHARRPSILLVRYRSPPGAVITSYYGALYNHRLNKTFI